MYTIEMIEPTKRTALLRLKAAILDATNTSLFDDLAVYVHPDIINQFCDAVGQLMEVEL